MAELVARKRSLIPLGERGPIEGWMDDDVASAATQLFGSGPSGLLVDRRAGAVDLDGARWSARNWASCTSSLGWR